MEGWSGLSIKHTRCSSSPHNNSIFKMLSRIFFVCLSLSYFCAGSSLSCRWITDEKFKQHSKIYLELLDKMASNNTNSSEVEHRVGFPKKLYKEASAASAEDKLGFAVQILNETAALFEEDHGSASWDESTEENFLMAVTEQADKLRSCMGDHSMRRYDELHTHFGRLSSHVLQDMHYSADAWETIRKKLKMHLIRIYLLISRLRSAN